MARYNSTSLALAEEAAAHDCFTEVEGYLSSEDGYWLSHDIWMKDSAAFSGRGISLENVRRDVIADFSTAPAGRVRTELKYYVLWSLSMGVISASTFVLNYRPALICPARAGRNSVKTWYCEFSAGPGLFWRTFMTSVTKRKKMYGGHCGYPGQDCQRHRNGQSQLFGLQISLITTRRLSSGTCAVW